MFVLDSSVLIETIKDGRRMHAVASLIPENEPLVTTTICMHEVLAGARTAQERLVFEGLFAKMHVFDHTVEAARAGARIEQELSHSGTLINAHDILIAGVCKANNAELVTFDKDFARIKGIQAHILT